MVELAHPYARAWAVDSAGIAKYPVITGNWDATRERIASLRSRLRDQELPGLRCVAAAGSIGRMEYGKMSDGDLIVLVDDGLDDGQAGQVYQAVWRTLESEGLGKPNPGGVFASPARVGDLCGSEAGSASEPRDRISKRLLLLLESQPLWGDAAFDEAIDAILQMYARNYVARDPTKEWTFLLNDLVRYFRAVCVHYQWDLRTDPAHWRIRNLKLRHSRVIMYSGLLLLLGECSKERVDKLGWLRGKLRFTPLERIAEVYQRNDDWDFHRVAGPYDFFLGRFNDPELRNKLVAEERTDTYVDRYQFRPYAELKTTSDALAAELMRFILSRRGSWTDRFFEYLLV